MSRRERLETEIENMQDKIAKAPKETPHVIRESWEQELVNLELELNNLVDGDEDNNE